MKIGSGLFAGSLLVAGLLAFGASAAGALVTVTPGSAPKGARRCWASTCPTKEVAANTVSVEVLLPTKNPFASVSTQPLPGWAVAVEKTTAG